VANADCGGGLLRGDLNEAGSELAVAGFVMLWRGVPARPEDLLVGRGQLAREVAEVLEDRGRAELDEHGRLVGIHGLTLRTTRHQFTIDGRDHHTWCAFDAIGIPAALRADAIVHTDCPTCRAAIDIPLAAGLPTDSRALVWIPGSVGVNLIADFCSRADLYCDRDHLLRSVDASATNGDVLDLPAACALGSREWCDVTNLDL
jgi:alkylmercury lyase